MAKMDSQDQQDTTEENILELLREEIDMLSLCNPSPQPGPQGVGTTIDNPTTSCKEIHEYNPTAPSGYYWVNTTTGPLQVYCQMETNNCGNITGGWMRAAYIDMTNESNTCPQGLNYTVESSTRMCTRSQTGTRSCSSVTFPTHGVPYTKICGRARGYQYGHTYAFRFSNDGYSTLNRFYASGLSVTYGSPRNHIWTFASGFTKHSGSISCPCFSGTAAPSYVAGHWFCESGYMGGSGIDVQVWHLDDPLWDSQGCASGSTCCDRGGPWFTTTLSQEVSNDIEMRLCNYYNDIENIGVDQLEIFIY